MVRAPPSVLGSSSYTSQPSTTSCLATVMRAGVQVGVGPLLPACLAPPQAAEGDQVEQGVQAVLGDVVEEGAGLLRRPDHHGRRLLAGALPVRDPFLGPHQRLGSLAGLQLDVGGRVEGDELLGDRGVQRGAQGGADALAGGRAGDAAEGRHLGDGCLHRLAAGTVLARPSRGSGQLVDRARGVRRSLPAISTLASAMAVEHLRQVADAQTVEPVVPDAGLEVDADVGLVAADGRTCASSCPPATGPAIRRP